MIQKLTFLVLLSIGHIVKSQPSFFEKADTLHPGRTIGISTGVGSIWGGSMIGLWQLWYADSEKTGWHSFDDSDEWMQMDKAGHFFTAYKLNELNSRAFEWAGVNHRTALWIGTGVSLGYQTTLEFLDAYNADWGFSWSDVAANGIGTAGYLTQQLIWGEERIIPKFSYAPTSYAQVRPEVLGNTFATSLLKDYNGQTYWLSFSPGTFSKNNTFPSWLCFSFGYSVDEKLVGTEDEYVDPTNGRTYTAQRELLFSLDIDFRRLPIKRPWLKTLVGQFNYLKIPFPALVLRDNQITGSWLGY